MKRGSLLVIALAVGTLAAPAGAQSIAETPADEAYGIREQKPSALASRERERLVRVLDFVEHRIGQLTTSRDGFSVRLGGIESGSWFAAGPMWQKRPLNGAMWLRTSAAVSIASDYDVDAGLAVPELGSHRISLDLGASKRHLAQERFYGLGMSTTRAAKTMFELDRSEVHAAASVTPASWLDVSVRGTWADYSVADGTFAAAPSISVRFDGRSAPGLGSPAAFAVVSVGAAADWRDVPGNPRSGGRHSVALERYSDQSPNRYSFTRATIAAEQHFSWWRRQRVLSLRGLAVLSAPDSGNDVPFYLQPTLGGSRMLRGFATDRFRDRNLLWAQAEYGWDLWPFLGAVLFYETGVVASDASALSATNLKRDYGVGFRFGSARTIAIRTDVALGSGEGTRIAMRFSHAF